VPRKTAENTVKHHGGGVGSVVANHRGGGEISMVVTTLVNMNKTKVMTSGERQKPLQKAARWPCGVCGRCVGSNSIQCTSCHKWVHNKCSGIKGSMYKVMRSFICRG